MSLATTDPTKHGQGYGRRDPASGMLRGHIYYPDGRPPVPSGCRWCGIPLPHWKFWRPGKGFHDYEPPTQAQILARMRARRAARLNAPPAQYHATTGWAPEFDGESAEPYCADCGTTTCRQWNRIHNRLQMRRMAMYPCPF